ncbi:MAG TPA: endonuclease/exonuclease/phosphatase family protein [Gaiellaceae bacterium]|nr:endonuclease/exonuclease/phosphatase family protein [Gaiellaceae bacterium]
MTLLVRTWNLFHGRTVPEGRRLELERMVKLVTADRPALVGLQELPAWALPRLDRWSGMRIAGAVAMPPLGGPLALKVTELHPRWFRSALVGQANALLFGAEVEPLGRPRVVRLNPAFHRRSVPTSLGVRFHWLWNRRVAQIVPVRVGDERLTVVNLHASKHPDLANAELDRLAELLPEGPAVVVGDFNVRGRGLRGFSPAIPGIDQILVRGLEVASLPAPWPDERRRHGETLLSDHAPVEARVAVR